MQNIAEEIIEFADRSEAMALLGERDEYIRVLMENFDARFISRGEALEISGLESKKAIKKRIMAEIMARSPGNRVKSERAVDTEKAI